jgi:2-C-methyl-D-erythritol 4-phosphate cytidylyltransferase
LIFKRLKTATVILAAAGSGTRMGGVSKPLMKISGKEAILYSLDLFDECSYVERIVISTRKEDIETIEKLVKAQNYKKEIIVTEGGSTRQESVKLAFRAGFDGRKKTHFVAVHDAARPLITKEELMAAFSLAEKYGSAVCAAKAKDTFKTTDRNCVVTGHVERENLWHIQTPQIFDTDMFHTALALAERDKTEATDESGLVSEAGFIVKLSECGHDNIKLTYPEDAYIAEAILEKRKRLAKKDKES